MLGSNTQIVSLLVQFLTEVLQSTWPISGHVPAEGSIWKAGQQERELQTPVKQEKINQEMHLK